MSKNNRREDRSCWFSGSIFHSIVNILGAFISIVICVCSLSPYIGYRYLILDSFFLFDTWFSYIITTWEKQIMSLKNNNNKNEIVLNYDAVWADIWGGPWLSFDFVWLLLIQISQPPWCRIKNQKHKAVHNRGDLKIIKSTS